MAREDPDKVGDRAEEAASKSPRQYCLTAITVAKPSS